MAVVSVTELLRGTGCSGKYGETYHFTRKFKVRCDTLTTPKPDIVGAVGVGYGDGHPDFASCVAMEFDCADGDESGLWWDVTWKYYVPPTENEPDSETDIPKDSWAATGGTTTSPCWKDKDGVVITNSAGDPLEDLEKEQAEFGWTLTKNYLTTFWQTTAMTYSNAVNSGDWVAAGDTRCWKCAFKNASYKSLTLPDGTKIPYWETQWEFFYRAYTVNEDFTTVPGWDLTPWDIGFAQKVDASGTPTASGDKRAAITGQDKKPVKAPVALDGNGMAKPAGEKPDALQFRVYSEQNFTTAFGVPP
jgi:hypothetical protein